MNRLGKATLRVRMGSHDAHYGGQLVDGARMLALFGDLATELLIRLDGDEGLFRAYDKVEFLAPVRAGDYIEVTGEITRVGATSRAMQFEARKVVEALPAICASAAEVLSPSVVVCRATGTCVVPRELQRRGELAPVVITAAIVGAETTRAQNPHVPYSAEEIGLEAARCAAEGASVIHLHVRRDDGSPSQDRELFCAAIRAIRTRAPDLVIQTSTGGAVGMSLDERAQPLTLSGADRPEMATLNVGSVNFGDDVFVNMPLDVEAMAGRIRAAGITPEIEIYDLGHLDILASLIAKGALAPPLHVQFVLGVRGALAATDENLDLLVARAERMRSQLGGELSWVVAGVGKHQLPLAESAIRLGGHVRVGLEDNIYISRGVLAEGSAPLVRRAAELAKQFGRKVADPHTARKQLGL